MSHLALVLYLLLKLTTSEGTTLAVNSITDPKRVNVHFNVTNNKNYSSSSPNPDITILSDKYFLCLWSYVKEDASNLTTYSNEIYSNLFSLSSGRAMVRTEYLLNRIRGYSQDTPSATALFNTSNHITRAVAVVWESQVEDPSKPGHLIDAVFGRIIKWSITYSNGYRYVKVTSPSSKEFQISDADLDYLHHRNPDVIPIYNTGKFFVSWISQSEDNTYNMVFIRIYYNGGSPYSDQIMVHDTDGFWKKYPRTIPLLHNLTLVTWLSQSISDGISSLVVYGMVFDKEGQSTLSEDEGLHTFLSMTDDTLHTIYEDTTPVIAHLHNDPHENNNYFVLAWNAWIEQDESNRQLESNTLRAAVYMYDGDANAITQISDITSLFDEAYASDEFKIASPVMENIVNQLYEYENGLDAKIAVCYSLKDIENDKSDIFCKIMEVSLWNSGERVSADISIVTEDTMINPGSENHHQHEHPALSSESILRAQADFTDTPEFVVTWSNSREGGYDVYTRILEVSSAEGGSGSNGNDGVIFGSQLNVIIFGVVFGIIL
eukprot:529070_1